MIDVDIPGFKRLRLEHLVLDFNGTLATGGHLIEGVRNRLAELGERLVIHVVTADTFGRVREELAGAACQIHVLHAEAQSEAKRDYVTRLTAEATVAIGNGRNDRLMLERAALGICIVGTEGAAREALQAAAVTCPSILEALDLLREPLRLVATLRS